MHPVDNIWRISEKQNDFQRYAVTVYVTVLSVVLLVAVAFDRYLSICHPIKYEKIMRGRIAK